MTSFDYLNLKMSLNLAFFIFMSNLNFHAELSMNKVL